MRDKHTELQAKINGLVNFTLLYMSLYAAEEITEEVFKKAMDFADEKHEEIQAEIAVMELLEGISLN